MKSVSRPEDTIEVSALGSACNGIGEARRADFGITGAEGTGIIYAKGQPLRKVTAERLIEELFVEIDKYYAAGEKLVVDDAQAAEAARWLRATRTPRGSDSESPRSGTYFVVDPGLSAVAAPLADGRPGAESDQSAADS